MALSLVLLPLWLPTGKSGGHCVACNFILLYLNIFSFIVLIFRIYIYGPSLTFVYSVKSVLFFFFGHAWRHVK